MDFSEPELASPTLVRPNPVERLLAPVRAGPRVAERWRLAALVAGLLLCHIGLLALFFEEYGVEPQPPEQEIAVEVVPPPEQAAQAPEPPPQPEQKQEAQKKPPPDIDMTPAEDAARKVNKETVDREAPDQNTQAQKVAPPAEQGADAKAQEKPSDARAVIAPMQGPVMEKSAEEKPDAEAIEHALPKPDDLKRSASPEQKTQTGQTMPTIAQMMARLEPTPDYKIAGAATETPNATGTAKPNYLSLLHGIIMQRFREPPAGRQRVQGSIAIYLATTGHLLHAGVLQPSGSPDLDRDALDAIKKSAPFPPPPPGTPTIVFTYCTGGRCQMVR